MARILVDSEYVRRIIREEIYDDKYRSALFSTLFNTGTPVTREQASDMMDGKLGKFALTVPTLVRSEVGKHLASSSGVTELLSEHRNRVADELRIHQSDVQRSLDQNKRNLEQTHSLQLERTKQSMEQASKQVVDKMLKTDDGGTIVKGIEGRLRSDQNMMFYGGIVASFAAGVVGGFVGAAMKRVN